MRFRLQRPGVAGCLIPGFDGAFVTPEWKEALWARFFSRRFRMLRIIHE
jgi:hypothetical protein